jgi:autotransporter-associated beta strand protein
MICHRKGMRYYHYELVKLPYFRLMKRPLSYLSTLALTVFLARRRPALAIFILLLCSLWAKGQYLTSGAFAADGSSVIDVGSVLYAFNLDESGQGSPDLNGVTFAAINSNVTSSPDFSISNSGGYDNTPAGTPTTAGIYPLVANGAYNNLTLTLDDLTPGQTYAAQLVIGEQTGDSRSQYYTDGFSTSPTVYPINGPQYILDTFTATGTSETLIAHVGGGAGAQLTGFVVEDAPAPASTTLYYDTNGVTAGTNTTGSSNFTDSDWTTDPTGSSVTSGFIAGSNVIFSAGTNGTGAQNVTVTDSEDVSSLTVNNGTVTLLGSGSPALSIGNGGITNNSTDGPTTFDSTLGTVQATANEQWNNDSSQALNINSGVTSAGATITFDGTGSGAVNLNGQLTGSLNLTQDSTKSTVYLNNTNNTFTGTITVDGGGLVFANEGSLNNNAITLSNGGVLESANEVFSEPNDDITNTITLGAGGGEVSGGVVGSYGNDTVFAGTFTGGTGLSVVNGDFLTQADGTSDVGTLNITGPSRLLVGTAGIFGNNAVVNVGSTLDFGWYTDFSYSAQYGGTLNNTINLLNGGAIENRGPGTNLTDVIFPTGTATVTLGSDDVGGGSITVGGPGINVVNGTTLTIISNSRTNGFTEYNDDPNQVYFNGAGTTSVSLAENITGSGNLILDPETDNIYDATAKTAQNTPVIDGTRFGYGSPLYLTGDNSGFTGTTTINNLTVYPDSGGFGSSAASVILNSATIQLTGGTLANSFTANTGTSYFDISSGTQTLSGPINVPSTGALVFSQSGTGALTTTGQIEAAGGVFLDFANSGSANMTVGNIDLQAYSSDEVIFLDDTGSGNITLNGTYTSVANAPPQGSIGSSTLFIGYLSGNQAGTYYIAPSANLSGFEPYDVHGKAAIWMFAGNLDVQNSSFIFGQDIALTGPNESFNVIGGQTIDAGLYVNIQTNVPSDAIGDTVQTPDGSWTISQTTADLTNMNGYTTNVASGFTMSVVDGGRLVFNSDMSGYISNSITTSQGTFNEPGSGTIVKTGAGVVAFNDPSGNDYQTPNGVVADIQQGTLLVNNTQGAGYALGTSSGVVKIEKGATLGGNASFSSNQTVVSEDAGAIIAPGDAGQASLGIKPSIGTLNLGNLSIASNADPTTDGITMDFKLTPNLSGTIDGTPAPSPGVDNDFLTAAYITLSGTVTINITDIGGIAVGTPYTLIYASSGLVGDPIDPTDPAYFTLNINTPAGYALDPDFGNFRGFSGYIFDTAGGNLIVQFIAVPEPSTYLLLGLGLAGMMIVGRLRKLSL